MKKSFDIEKWNSLSDRWKDIYAINIVANFRISKNQREKIFYVGLNPFNCYKSYFSKDFINNITQEEIIKLPELTHLYLSNLTLSEIPLSDYFNNISLIDISYNQYVNLNFLENCSSLNELYCECNLISEINVINNLKNISQLNIRENKIHSITSIRHLNKLNYLDIGRNQIRDISPLSELNEIEEIQADLNSIELCAPVVNLPKLKTLVIAFNPIQDCSELNKLAAIKYLDIQDTGCARLNVLDSLKKIPDLELIS